MHHQNKILILACLSITISASAQRPNWRGTGLLNSIRLCYSLRIYMSKLQTFTMLSSIPRPGTL